MRRSSLRGWATIAALAIKRRDGPTTTFQVPTWVPFIAVAASTVMFAAEIARLAGWT